MQSNWIISERVRRTSDRADLMVSEWGRLGERGLMIWEHIEMPKDNAVRGAIRGQRDRWRISRRDKGLYMNRGH